LRGLVLRAQNERHSPAEVGVDVGDVVGAGVGDAVGAGVGDAVSAGVGDAVDPP